MFDGILPATWDIYATTASNPDESSWGTYCPPQDMVNGVELGSCLGDLYSVNWMQNSDSVGPAETLEAQFVIVQNETTQSHVMQYGDQTWTSEATGDYIGEGSHHHSKKSLVKTIEPATTQVDSMAPAMHVDSRDIPVHLAYYKYVRATKFSPESTAALAELRAQLDSREAADARFTKLAELLSMDRHTGSQIHYPAHLFNTPKAPVESGVCVKSAVAALQANDCDYDDYSLQFHRVIVNACAQHTHQQEMADFIVEQIEKVCAEY